jgi:hypothetical protein
MPRVEADETVDPQTWSLRKIIAKGEAWDKKQRQEEKKKLEENQKMLPGEEDSFSCVWGVPLLAFHGVNALGLDVLTCSTRDFSTTSASCDSKLGCTSFAGIAKLSFSPEN